MWIIVCYKFTFPLFPHFCGLSTQWNSFPHFIHICKFVENGGKLIFSAYLTYFNEN